MKFLNWDKNDKAFHDPMLAMAHLQEEINDFFKDNGWSTMKSWDKDFSPSLDVKERDDSYMVEMEVPGMSEEDVKCSLKDNILTVKGEKKSEREEKEEGWIRKERRYGSFMRKIPFASAVNEENVRAKMKDGVLRVEIEKNPQGNVPERQIAIKKD